MCLFAGCSYFCGADQQKSKDSLGKNVFQPHLCISAHLAPERGSVGSSSVQRYAELWEENTLLYLQSN